MNSINSAEADVWSAGVGDWTVGTNWVDGSAPAGGDVVSIENAGTAELAAVGLAAAVTLGVSATGTLKISGGGVLTSSGVGTLGNNAGSTGTVSVDGAGSQWNSSNTLTVGDNGTGTLNITNGGVVSNTVGSAGGVAASTGTVSVDGAGSQWNSSSVLFVGNRGTGTLNITNGGVVSNTTGRIGRNSGGTGTVTVDGAGSQWNSSNVLTIGTLGTGTLNITNGGVVSNTSGAVGSNTGSTGTVSVDGAGSQWNSSSALTIGTIGTGTLNITNGGVVSNTAGQLGDESSSTGTVTVDGAGSQWNNSTTLRVGNSGTGTLNISDGGVVSGTTVEAGRIAGSSGTINIGTGGASGILNVTSLTGGSGTGVLNFNHTNANYLFTKDGTAGGNSVLINGSMAVNHIGSGSTTLTGVNNYTGATTIQSGTLIIDGSISNSTTAVNSGGILGGTGTTGAVNVNSGGTFAPGNSIGTTNVSGNVVFGSGSTYELEIDATGATDLIDATGTATLDGTVKVLAEAGNYDLATKYTILTADTGLGGTTFAGVTSDFVFLDPTLTYDANNVFLQLLRNNTSLGSFTHTPNQAAVASTLTTLETSNPDGIQDILDPLLGLSADEANQAFDSLSGIQNTNYIFVTHRVTQQFMQSLINRGSQSATRRFSDQSLASSRTLQLAYNGNDWASLAAGIGSNMSGMSKPERGLWARGLGNIGSVNGDGNARGFKYGTGGVAFGADHEWNNLVIGVAGSYARSKADVSNGSTHIDSYQMAGYGSWKGRSYYLNATTGFAGHMVDSSRNIIVGSFQNRAEANYETYNISAAFESGKDMTLPFSRATTVTPFVGLDYSHSFTDSFTDGAGQANLNVRNGNTDSLRTSAGIRLSHDITTSEISKITPYTTIAYVREHMDRTIRMRAGFAGAQGTTFNVGGPRLDRNRVRVGAGLTGQINEITSVNLGYQGELADSHEIHSISASARILW